MRRTTAASFGAPSVVIWPAGDFWPWREVLNRTTLDAWVARGIHARRWFAASDR
jgi:hypothetical protein